MLDHGLLESDYDGPAWRLFDAIEVTRERLHSMLRDLDEAAAAVRLGRDPTEPWRLLKPVLTDVQLEPFGRQVWWLTRLARELAEHTGVGVAEVADTDSASETDTTVAEVSVGRPAVEACTCEWSHDYGAAAGAQELHDLFLSLEDGVEVWGAVLDHLDMCNAHLLADGHSWLPHQLLVEFVADHNWKDPALMNRVARTLAFFAKGRDGSSS